MAQEAFPLHFLVWNNQYLELDRELQKNEVSQEVCFAAGGWYIYMFFKQMRLLGGAALRWCCWCVWFCSRMWSASIRGGAPRWSWPCVWATWSQPGCCSGTPQTPHTATDRAGPVSALPCLPTSHGNKEASALNVDVCLSLAGGGEHRGPRASAAGASVQRLQACHWEAGRHPGAAQQTETGKTASQRFIWLKASTLQVLNSTCCPKQHTTTSATPQSFCKLVLRVYCTGTTF